MIYISTIPILLFLSSFSLLLYPVFNQIMKSNKIGGGIPIQIYDKVNKNPMEAKLLLLTNENIVVKHNNFVKIFNKKDIGTINFRGEK